MTIPGQPLDRRDTNRSSLERELEKGLASGVSKRTPAQIRADYRRARDAA